MAIGDFFSKTAGSIANAGELIVDGSTAETGAVEVHTFAITGAFRLFKEVDTTGDGTYDVSIQIDQGSSAHSQKNKIEVSSSDNMRLRLRNIDTDPVDAHVTGIEVSD